MRYSTAILKCSNGRFILVGAVPVALMVDDKKSLVVGGYKKSMVWDTEKQAINALLSIGINSFQLSDCSWYKPEVPK